MLFRSVKDLDERCIADIPYFVFDGYVLGVKKVLESEDGDYVTVLVSTTRGSCTFTVRSLCYTDVVNPNARVGDLNDWFSRVLNREAIFGLIHEDLKCLDYLDEADYEILDNDIAIAGYGVLHLGKHYLGMKKGLGLEFDHVIHALASIINSKTLSQDLENFAFVYDYIDVVELSDGVYDGTEYMRRYEARECKDCCGGSGINCCGSGNCGSRGDRRYLL